MEMCTLRKILGLNLILISPYLLEDVFSQRIQLFPYNETKNCKMSLVEEMDRIVMYGKVDLNGNINTPSDVYFEIKRKSKLTFVLLCFLKVPEDCDKYSENYCSCHKTNDPKVFQVLGNITAYKDNSEADIRVELVYRETSFYSEIRQLPIVYGPETDSVEVYVNDQVVHTTQTNVTINDTQVRIFSKCLEKFKLHCTLQLTNSETQTILKSGKQVVIYDDNFDSKGYFNLKYIICDIPRNFSFLINKETTEHIKHFNFDFTSLEKTLISTNCFSLAINLLVFLFLLRKIIKHQVFVRISSRHTILLYNECNRSKQNEELRPLTEEGLPTYENHQINEKNSFKMEKIQSLSDKKTINITDIPIRYRDEEFFELLKVLSELTCRITLTKQSYKMSAFGIVTHVVKYCYGVGISTVNPFQSRECPCKKCLESKSPSDTWTEIFITTSSTILKNKNYKHIKCVLSVAENTITLRDISVERIDRKNTGLCVLKNVTCDQPLIERLQVLQEKYLKQEERVQDTFHQYKDNDRIYISIAYKEDDTKDICFGRWSIKKNKDGFPKYCFNPEIPFGNVGAPIIIIGYSDTDDENKQTRSPNSEILLNNFSTSVFTIQLAHKVITE